LARAIITAVFCILSFTIGLRQQAWAGTLGQSVQSLTLTGLGPNASGDGVSQVTWGDCSFDGTKTNCTLSGPFTGLGPGGTYDFVLSYPGDGQSPLTAITAPGSEYFTLSLSAGSLTYTFNESNGTSLSFNRLDYSIFYIQGTFACTGGVASCDPGTVGQTPGATESGPVNGTFALAPTIQTVISAGSYGGFTSIAPATWIEIYGQNLATTTADWTGGFQGNNAPTTVGGTTVTVGGESLFIDYVSPGQVNGQVPSDVAAGPQQVIVTNAAGTSPPFTITVNPTEPGLLAPPGSFVISGTQYAVALFSDGFYDLPPGLVSEIASRRAVPGDTIMLYGIGFGPVSDGTSAGVIDQNLNQLDAALDIAIGGVSATIQYAGLTPQVVGLYQFNVVVPDIPANDKTPLTFTLNGTPGTQTMFLFIGN
jgi:uncharacterized protein (TIGR03437 family)